MQAFHPIDNAALKEKAAELAHKLKDAVNRL